MIVTIDGPAGSGKSTAARELARRLGFAYLDTGAMYRAVALAVIRRGADPADPAAVEAALAGLQVHALAGEVRLGDEDVTALIRTPEVAQGSSQVAAVPAVRRLLVAEQRRTAEGRDIVCEGRDQGSVVFPQAACKFFLVADPAVRAERRYREMLAKGQPVTLEEVRADQRQRDLRDSTRPDSPLTQPADAVVIDTTHLTPDEMVAHMETEVRRRCPTART
jgi:cytidylate kinase